ncbi:flagellar brake domain-containing protein [Desulfospira joergensenii]|uniref:flagellar brake domain-containing protein n=1 Tax=Desulfospira joergensenii TaxID=53329 RepID=UPI0003B3EC3A|nr:flagellar brake protein [Desulfospira joergensenii]
MEGIEDILELDKSEGLNIEIGTEVYLDITGVSFSVSSIFVGLLENEFMIITLPKRFKSVQNKLYPGNKMIVKYLHEGSLYAFQTSVIEMITDPIRALAIEYPKIVQKQELRVVKRNSVVIPGRVELKKNHLPVVVFDISKKGCCFKYIDDKKNNFIFREGDLLRIFCQFPGVESELGAMAYIRNIRREKRQISIGTEFSDMTKKFISPLMEFLCSIEGFQS